MGRHLQTAQIESACATLLRQGRRVTVREVVRFLRQNHGTGGRTERVAKILRQVESAHPYSSDPAAHAEVERLRSELDRAMKRAHDSEEMERAHQNFWATRYADKLVELEHRERALRASTVPSDRYLRVYQRMAEFERRLAEYEPIYADPLVPKPQQ